MARSSSDDPLKRYAEKRDFAVTSEPQATRARSRRQLGFVIQKHWASRLHYDFRLELDGVLVSWAVPKGPSFDPVQKRMAIHVEDHPVKYGSFEGTIPPKQYGAGKVIVWDNGSWEPVGDPAQGLARGKLEFRLHGQKLAGLWELVRIAKPGERQEAWLLFKKRDEWARPVAEYDVVSALPDSVIEQPLGPVEEREPQQTRPPAASPVSRAGPQLSAARKAALPASLRPQLATLVASPPATGEWVCETKFDGYRLLARIEGPEVRLVTRNGHDWTHKLATLAEEVAALGIESAWLDGEIVVLNAAGVPDFNALQNAMDAARSGPVVYFVFDAPFLGGYDLRAVPLQSRRQALVQAFHGLEKDRVRLSQTFDIPPGQLLGAACEMGLEGVMLKRADAPYVSDRTDTWLKLKCQRRQEFILCGYTDRTNAPGEVGGLLLGYHDDEGELRYAGKVGTGWDHSTGRELHQRLRRLGVEQAPFEAGQVKRSRWSRSPAGENHWVRPELVAEVAFSEWTPDGHVRHASYKGLRSDKPPKAITRERSAEAPATRAPAAKSTSSPAAKSAAARKPAPYKPTSESLAVKITHPQRVIDPSTGLRKQDLMHYYEAIAARMLPHMHDRPVSLVRAPQGIAGQHFFQKHPEASMPGLTALDEKLWPGHAALMAVDSAQALITAAQLNVVEFHTWNATTRHIGKPDRVVFDLDPGEGVPWPRVREAAELTHVLLAELGLQAWLKTSGGKGLHVVVPLARRLDAEAVKAFSQQIVQHLARTVPSRFVAKSGPSNRVGKVFVDYLRNGHGQTTVAAFSARARPGLGVSMPISWEALKEIKSGAQWTIATAREYLSFEHTDPWADYWTTSQNLGKALKALAGTAGSSVRRQTRK